MYSLLVVDDEATAVEGVTADLRMSQLGLGNVYTAFNARQAKERFAAHGIDILLCDIEMPQGNGLELLEWVRSEYPDTETLFLTSHADFKYAQKAITLGCLDYLLKPVPAADLQKAVRRAVSELDKRRESANGRRFRHLWLQHQPALVEQFWSDLVSQTIPTDRLAVKSELEKRNLGIAADAFVVPILVHIRRWTKPLTLRHEKIMEYALRKSAEEIFADAERSGQTVRLEPGRFLVLLPAAPDGTKQPGGALTEQAENYIAACRRYFYCELICRIGKPSPVHETAMEVHLLATAARDHHHRVATGSLPANRESKQPVPPDMKVVTAIVRQASGDGMFRELTSYLSPVFRQEGWTAAALHRFQQEFMQMFYPFLGERGKQAHRLLCDDRSMELAEKAHRSASDLLAWMEHAIGKTFEEDRRPSPSESIVEEAKRYIAIMIDQDELCRESVAGHVNLNPDYLSRLFKKETGLSVSDYIMAERIAMARRLLTETSIPVSAVAASVGHFHFSHFSKIFKKHTALTPVEYRQQHGAVKKS